MGLSRKPGQPVDCPQTQLHRHRLGHRDERTARTGHSVSPPHRWSIRRGMPRTASLKRLERRDEERNQTATSQKAQNK